MAFRKLASKKITKEEVDEILKQHALWLENKETGKRADLSGYMLEEFDLSGADLSEANLNECSIYKTKMIGVNLTGASLKKADLSDVDLTEAILDYINMEGGDLFHSKLIRVHAEHASFEHCVMWDNDFTDSKMKDTSFKHSKLDDGRFIGADLCACDFFCADIDYTNFTNANLEYANLTWADDCYWARFTDANLHCAFITGCEFSDEKIHGAKDLDIYMSCPEEGSFIAWWKSRDERIAKLLIPEQALRTGGNREWCRASEVSILEIYDGENTCDNTTGLLGDDKVYYKGESIKAEKFDSSLYHDGDGISFRMSRAETEKVQYKETEKEEQTEVENT